ncbi:phenylalanine 4-monooxygenase [Vibrio aestuarianus]|uniref:phenylalanine 4-monooxygenase n=1 Tax=Vibrio aestuarianus TaxID=28171 RepID=UPI00237C8935|nr:phenylalanine 4-monooxygenase [Vibrio aestuarianus]MDE1230163.1 phenylalanine 4-monooxygenase [Vibrio aestuarianus]MDE1265037.1 phenylalanine 4-monooxygenase [Vibrio aestuarianus]MDE1296965.1 phenylalanine 4-monooxygenase [Vibrio aestuarianus]MDE1336706.1 phenylalanine 4-monooxygenase [Vibrio aestuarianus]MDE1350534.1 phenylalanine 4-monooxygenase [Vibrio aestuarianus]
MTQYHSKPLNSRGLIDWSGAEDAIWHDLVSRQKAVIQQRACQAYLDGLELLQLPNDYVPQLTDINRILQRETGWQVEPVPALINFDRFFALLADKKFPVATFLRTREEFDYLQEPDFFHEIFGHCAMLTHPDFAAFTHKYGQLGAKADHKQRVYLARLYWFSVEFGLVQERGETKIYGGGILSSPGETVYSLDSDVPKREIFDIQQVLRTPYRIDIMQPMYYVLHDLSDLYHLSQQNLMYQVEKAMKTELLTPLFQPKEETHA